MWKPARILVAVDFSDASLAALDLAGSLAKAVGGTLDLLHVWEVPAFLPPDVLVASAGADTATLVALVKDRADEEMRRLRGRAEDAGLPVSEARTEPGYPGTVIPDRAKEGGYDLVVVGTHGRTGLGRLLLGSVAEKVVRHCAVPVLVARSLPQ